MMKRRLFIWLGVFLVLIFGVYLFHPFILGEMANYLIIRDQLKPSDVIIVLGGDADGERVAAAVALYRQKLAPKLLVTAGPLAWRLTGGAWMAKQAVFLGVPQKNVLLEEKARSTYDNARFTLPLVKKLNAKSVIVVTSPTHTRRSKMVFKHLFSKAGIEVLIYPVPRSSFQAAKWWTRHEDTQQVVWEYVSLVYYLLRRY